MEQTILLLGQRRIEGKSLTEIIKRCELPDSQLIIKASSSGGRKTKTRIDTWLIIINAKDFDQTKELLTSLDCKNNLVPVIVILTAERKELEVLLSLGACDVISPEILDEKFLTRAILSAIERKRIEAELIARDAILKAINFAAEVFLTQMDWDSRIIDVLARLGEAARADKVYICQIKPGEKPGQNIVVHSGWVSKGIKQKEASGSEVDCEILCNMNSHWQETLSSGEMVIGLTSHFPHEEQSALKVKQIRSIAIIPIYSDHLIWGLLTFEYQNFDKQWTDEEIESLYTFTRILGAGISRVDAEIRLTHLATHDFLTNLPNRMLLEDRFDQAIARAGRSNKKFGIIAIDIDKFKQVNDSFGHPFGDKVLIEIAWRLSESIRTSDTCARVGGDEFTVLAEGIRNHADLLRVMEKISHALSQPIEIEGKTVNLTASFGASIYPDHGEEMETLMKAADVVLYQVKSAYAGFRIYKAAKQISLIEED